MKPYRSTPNEELLESMQSTFEPFSQSVEEKSSEVVSIDPDTKDDPIEILLTRTLHITDKTLQKFDSREMAPTNFAGVLVDEANGTVRLSQNDYINTLKLILEDCTFADLRSIRAKLAWITHPRPDISCAVNMSAQVTANTMSKEHIKGLNKVIKHLKKTECQKLAYEPLEMK